MWSLTRDSKETPTTSSQAVLPHRLPNATSHVCGSVVQMHGRSRLLHSRGSARSSTTGWRDTHLSHHNRGTSCTKGVRRLSSVRSPAVGFARLLVCGLPVSVRPPAKCKKKHCNGCAPMLSNRLLLSLVSCPPPLLNTPSHSTPCVHTRAAHGSE